MSDFPTDCLTLTSIQPSSTVLAGIEACQAAANTTYCFPPNGSRICAPAEEIPFFWPPKYYDPSAKVALSYDPSSKLILLQNNTGNDTQDFTPYIFDFKAYPIPGKPYDKTLKMTILERRMDDKVDQFNLKVHDGPTIVLVKTADWPITTSRTSSWPIATFTPPNDDRQQKEDAQFRGVKAGVLVAIPLIVAVVVILSVYCCCWKNGCCGRQPDRGPKMTRQEQVELLEEGNILMQQKNATVAPRSAPMEGQVGVSHMLVQEEARIGPARRDVNADEPPPQYMP